jgi:uncharacterized protein (DUF2336 family)
MIVRDFLQRANHASACERAEATSALARAYLYSDLSPDDLTAVEGVMLMLLDDRSPLVRQAVAEALEASPIAPPAVIMALAADQRQIAALVYADSPLFVDADLVDAVVTATLEFKPPFPADPHSHVRSRRPSPRLAPRRRV